MGQRLNLEIKTNDKVLANAYYHWSGYTTSSLEITKSAIQFILNNEIKLDVESAIKILEHTGASFNDKAWKNALDSGIVKGEFKECQGRNAGLIGVTESDMKETRVWEEGRIEINIENKSFRFKCAHEKDYIEDDDIWDKIKDMFFEIKDIENSYKIPFEKIDKLLDGVKISEDKYNGRFYFGYSCFDSIY
jgi:hypothetical protein